MSYHSAQENVRAMIQAQKYAKFSKAEVKGFLVKVKLTNDQEELLYFIDRDIIADTSKQEKSRYLVKANGIYYIDEDKMVPYVKGERFIYIRSGRMFEQ